MIHERFPSTLFCVYIGAKRRDSFLSAVMMLSLRLRN